MYRLLSLSSAPKTGRPIRRLFCGGSKPISHFQTNFHCAVLRALLNPVQCGILMPTLTERDTKKILIALAIYLASLFAANTLGLKIAPFLFGLHVSVAVFSFPFVFLTTDVIGEVYGKKIAKLFVLCGFVSIVLFLLYSLISLAL